MEPKIHTLGGPAAAGSQPLSVECLYARIPHDFNYIQAEPGHYKAPHPYGAGDSFMLVLSGAMDLIVDGETFPLMAGQLAVIPKGAHRGFTAGPEGMTMFAAHLRDE
jgi:mannose-6-phosphate isomerase-like protein (cupin superfamily)